MPRVKQVDSVQTMADRVLLESIVKSCNRLCVTGSVDELREGVAAMRDAIFNRMPPLLLADFADRILDKVYSDELEESQCQAVLGITMDVDIVGLKLRGKILRHLDPQQAHRFRKLAQLHLDSFSGSIRSPGKLMLDNFHLNGLVAFVYPDYCTDSDLKIIGENCPKLEVLRIKYSEYVSNEGLKDLDHCSNLRVVDVGHCSKVSHLGLNHLLSAHKQLEDVSYGYDLDHYEAFDERELHVLSGLDLTVEAPSIRRFVFEDDQVNEFTIREKEDVKSMDVLTFVLKFPNLEYLRINCIGTMNLSALRHLTKLTGLEINFVQVFYWSEFELTWLNIKEVLVEIGTRIITLKLTGYDQGFSWNQELNFIYNCCPNIEHLEFDYLDGLCVIPAFANLKVIIPRIPIHYKWLDQCQDPVLEFGTMSNLETLSLLNVKVELQTIKSMMLDDIKFPKLSLVKTNTLKTEDLAEIMAIAKANNLEFTVEHDSNYGWFTDYLADCAREESDYDTDDTE